MAVSTTDEVLDWLFMASDWVYRCWLSFEGSTPMGLEGLLLRTWGHMQREMHGNISLYWNSNDKHFAKANYRRQLVPTHNHCTAAQVFWRAERHQCLSQGLLSYLEVCRYQTEILGTKFHLFPILAGQHSPNTAAFTGFFGRLRIHGFGEDGCMGGASWGSSLGPDTIWASRPVSWPQSVLARGTGSSSKL